MTKSKHTERSRRCHSRALTCCCHQAIHRASPNPRKHNEQLAAAMPSASANLDHGEQAAAPSLVQRFHEIVQSAKAARAAHGNDEMEVTDRDTAHNGYQQQHAGQEGDNMPSYVPSEAGALLGDWDEGDAHARSAKWLSSGTAAEFVGVRPLAHGSMSIDITLQLVLVGFEGLPAATVSQWLEHTEHLIQHEVVSLYPRVGTAGAHTSGVNYRCPHPRTHTSDTPSNKRCCC